MPPIKAIELINAKWQKRAPEALKDYQDGVQNTKKDWAANTAAAADNYVSGIQAAIAAGRFEAGVARAGTEAWRQAAMVKGPARWAQGIKLSGDAYIRGFGRYHAVIANTTLPPRGPRGSAENYERSRIMGEALNRARLSGVG